MKTTLSEKKGFTKKVKAFVLCLALLGFFSSSQIQVSAVSRPGAMNISVNPTFVTGENIVINWTTSAYATKYGLTVWKAPYATEQFVVWDNYVTGNSQSIGALPAGNYLVQMKPYNSAGGGPSTNILRFSVIVPVATAQGGPPVTAKPAPALVKSTQASSMKVKVGPSFMTNENVVVSWTEVKGATKYGLSVWKAPYSKETVFDNYVTGTSRNMGKLTAGNYKIIMRPYKRSALTFFKTVTAGPSSDAVEFTVTNPKSTPPANKKNDFNAIILEESLRKKYPWNSTNCALNGKGESYYPEKGESSSGLDGHGYGCRQCVSFAAWRMNEITKKYLDGLGYPINWYNNAGKNGLKVITNPVVGAIAVWEKHVAVVENIAGNTVIVSEGNYNGGQIKVENKENISNRKDSGQFKGYVHIK